MQKVVSSITSSPSRDIDLLGPLTRSSKGGRRRRRTGKRRKAMVRSSSSGRHPDLWDTLDQSGSRKGKHNDSLSNEDGKRPPLQFYHKLAWLSLGLDSCCCCDSCCCYDLCCCIGTRKHEPSCSARSKQPAPPIRIAEPEEPAQYRPSAIPAGIHIVI